MKEIYKYQCDYCKTEYREKSYAENCENNHKIPWGRNPAITGCKYHAQNDDHSGYPLTINVKMNDGKTITYKRG